MVESMRVRSMPCWECGGLPVRDVRRRLCANCYARARYNKQLPDITWGLLLERMAIQGVAGCIEWAGNITSEGYGSYSSIYAHRASCEAVVGPIPDGLTIDHLCRNRACFNTHHLEPVTQAENNRRACAVITHCPQGHEYTDGNTYRYPDGHRQCRACHRASESRRQRQRRETEMAS